MLLTFIKAGRPQRKDPLKPPGAISVKQDQVYLASQNLILILKTNEKQNDDVPGKRVFKLEGLR